MTRDEWHLARGPLILVAIAWALIALLLLTACATTDPYVLYRAWYRRPAGWSSSDQMPLSRCLRVQAELAQFREKGHPNAPEEVVCFPTGDSPVK